MQAEFSLSAVPATAPLVQYKSAQVVGCTVLALCLAFAAGGGSLLVASRFTALKLKAQSTKAQVP
ncbi:hypothetical protein SBV1_3010001 [Verrucomicrobia bacterium]|nr:hypothetical protein SBV1_3010001 [Verrucomicrobiota bacterium]